MGISTVTTFTSIPNNNNNNNNNNYALNHPLLSLEHQIILFVHIRESPFLRNDNLLTPWELIPSATERLLDNRCIASNEEVHLPDVEAYDCSVGFTPSSTHTRLKSTHHTISAPPPSPHIEYTTNLSAPAQDSVYLIRITWKGYTRTLIWNESFPDVFVTYLFAQIRAASRASLVLVRYEVAAEREIVNGRAFTAQVEDPD